ncbi:hypothetical protein [Streptomyces ochraceiscleroticus]|uniref:Ig-like domain-containing protein n=1 Tax=Streptomyces ochraceiscleroticus TaxID=47761 RepID=A0ABW1MDZ4_9ACTN|nr:hypothetical protein [Streptomyces ochraceiscleroticus]
MSRSSRLSRASRLTAVAALLAAAGVPVASAPAHAVGTEVVCNGSQDQKYSPGLKLVATPQTFSETTTYDICRPLSELGIASGTSESTGKTPPMTCVDALRNNHVSKKITWNTGKTSTFTYDVTATHVGGQTVVTRTGTITSGAFAGQPAREVITGPTPDTLKCLKGGITERTGVATLTIFAL